MTDRKDALPAKHSQQLRVSEHYSDELSIIDADGFAVVEVPKVAVLEGYAEKLGIAHWADSPAASRELSDEEHSALVRRIVQCWNAHDKLVAACHKALGVLAGEDMNKQALIDALTLCRSALAKAGEQA